MYHYVRDLPRTQFPRIKGLLTRNFNGQLDYIAKHYSVCKLAEVVEASRGECELPTNACVLTFDDGLADHYQTVFPRLLERGFTGAFFPPARPLQERCALDVHKIQFVLAATEDHDQLAGEILEHIAEYRGAFDIPQEKELRRDFELPNRFDPSATAFVKKLLQWVLPEPVRSAVADRAFAKYVSKDESEFARELYLSIPQLREMIASGMEIGGHGYNHRWLGKLSRGDQEQEIRRTVSFLGEVFGCSPDGWLMCYPFGSYDTETLELVASMGCAAGVTTKVGPARPSNLLELDRFDTNDLPVSANGMIAAGVDVVR